MKALDALKMNAEAYLWNDERKNPFVDMKKLKDAKKLMAIYEPFTSIVFKIIISQEKVTITTATYEFIENNLHKALPINKGWKMPKAPEGYPVPVVEITKDGLHLCCWFSDEPDNLKDIEGNVYLEKDHGFIYPWKKGTKPDQVLWEALGFTVFESEDHNYSMAQV
ncbi:hypothetical protein [Marinicella sp. W31]|uniref:hypothetical protein n=1 Tax=Marinicella sp. W31 TaxID=3023713 RepID=UPI0037578424